MHQALGAVAGPVTAGRAGPHEIAADPTTVSRRRKFMASSPAAQAVAAQESS